MSRSPVKSTSAACIGTREDGGRGWVERVGGWSWWGDRRDGRRGVKRSGRRGAKGGVRRALEGR